MASAPVANLPVLETSVAHSLESGQPKKHDLYDGDSPSDEKDASSFKAAAFGKNLEEREQLPWFRQLFTKKEDINLDAVATQASVFDDPKLALAAQPKSNWESYQYFDPSFRWTWREEKAVIRILDFRVTAWMMICFLALHMDTSNIGSAVSAGLLKDLKLTTNDFNLGNTLFSVGFLLAEIPSQLISKRVGPDYWIPAQITAWSIVGLSQFWLQNKSGFLATRFILGWAQGGFLCDAVLYFSYFYTKFELPLRLGLFWGFARVCSMFMSLIAVGLLKLDGVGGYAGWRYLFLIEGCITLLIGLIGFVMFVPGPTQTKRRFVAPHGWFTERQHKIIANKILRDDPGKGQMHNRQGLTLTMFIDAFKDYDLWPLYLIGFLIGIPSSPIGTYLTYTLKTTLHFTVTNTNLLTIPAHFIGLVNTVGGIWFSERIGSRWIGTGLMALYTLPFLVTLYIRPVNELHPWAAYAVSALLVATPSSIPLIVAWISRNAGSVRTRTVSASWYNIILHFESLGAANVYRADDAPSYRRGNRQLIIICVVATLQAPAAALYYKLRNKYKERKWNALTPEEQQTYVETTKDEGAKRWDFKFAY